MTDATMPGEIAVESRLAGRSRSIRLRMISWTLLAVVVAVTLGFGALDTGGRQTNAERANALAKTIACPQCSGQAVGESEVAIAREIRADIARRVERGETDEQIRQVYAERYGDWVLLIPSATGVTGLVWIVPVVATAAGAAALVLAFLRWRSVPGQHATADDRALVAQALHDGDGDGDGTAPAPPGGHEDA